jgi:hypothetical protein
LQGPLLLYQLGHFSFFAGFFSCCRPGLQLRRLLLLCKLALTLNFNPPSEFLLFLNPCGFACLLGSSDAAGGKIGTWPVESVSPAGRVRAVLCRLLCL